ncbi:MAG: hypothetical protein JXA68_04870, partial [Ignavibacteriales bacterium]|nr:hypothetical protein [Ignavibacteriales bacterium]
MKRITMIVCLLFAKINFAQTNVDKAVEELNLLCNAVLDNWKYSTNFSAKVDEISRIDFDDSQWQNLRLNESIYPDSCWLRKVIELPNFIAGVPVSGRIKFIVSVDDYGYFYINGESKGHFPWDGEFTLTESGETGAKYVLLIKAVNTGGPLRIISAKLNFDKELPLQRIVNNFTLSLRVGQKLLSFDTYQTNSRVKVDPKIDKSTVDKERKIQLNELLQTLATQLDIEALRKGDTEKFLSSLENVKSQLKPVSDFAKEFKLHFTANAHIDAAWLWRKKETVDVCYKTFSSVMKMFEARPDFTYSQSQAVFYEWMEKQYPELFEKIKQYQFDGRWEIVGGMWIEPDCNLPDGISWARQMLYAQYYFIEKFGLEAVLGWNPDSFGYNWNLPQFLLQAGIKAFITQKIGWNDTSVFPYRLFWWQSPDSSKILTYFPFDYVNKIEDPFKLVDWMRQFEANTGFKNQMILFGIGDHG